MAHSVNGLVLRNEDHLQEVCFQWHWNTYPQYRRTLFHVQQKAKNRIEGARFKAIGVVRGVSDLILILPGTVAYIELKFEDGTQSEEQIDFEKKVTARGFSYYIVRTFPEFVLLVNKLNSEYYGK